MTIENPAIDIDKRALKEKYNQIVLDLSSLPDISLDTPTKKEKAIKDIGAALLVVLKVMKNIIA